MSDEISNNKISNPNFWYLVLEIWDLFKLRFLFPFGINYNIFNRPKGLFLQLIINGLLKNIVNYSTLLFFSYFVA